MDTLTLKVRFSLCKKTKEIEGKLFPVARQDEKQQGVSQMRILSPTAYFPL